MAAAKLNLVIEEGATFKKSLIWRNTEEAGGTPIDLTGKEGRMHIRESIDDATPQITLGSSEIVLGGVTGSIDITLGATSTVNLAFEEGVYDLEIFDPGDPDDVTRLLEGSVKVKPEVTR